MEPGEYGDIASRGMFRQRLDEVLDLAGKCLRKYPGGSAFQSIHAQLEAMKRATAAGRDPQPAERRGFDAGLLAIRELEGVPDDDVGELADSIHAVVAFYEDWPTDAEAAEAAAGAGP
jgi:hypothetical protein